MSLGAPAASNECHCVIIVKITQLPPSSLHVDRTYRTCVIISQNLTTNLSQALLGLHIDINIFDKFPIAFN